MVVLGELPPGTVVVGVIVVVVDAWLTVIVNEPDAVNARDHQAARICQRRVPRRLVRPDCWPSIAVQVTVVTPIG